MNINAFIVDDEEDSRNMLHNFISKYCPGVTVTGEAASVSMAAEYIMEQSPDLVFLDVNMPVENGFELFRRIPEPGFDTIFVTAYDEYALKAIKHHALDYILKPVDIAELINAVSKVKKNRENKSGEQLKTLIHVVQDMQKPVLLEQIALPVSDGLIYVYPKDIIRCEAEGNYTYFYFLNNTKLLVCHSLGVYEEMLAGNGFARIHHHHLVNLAYVEKYRRGKGGSVIMSDKTEVVVSHRRKDQFLKSMEERTGRK